MAVNTPMYVGEKIQHATTITYGPPPEFWPGQNILFQKDLTYEDMNYGDDFIITAEEEFLITLYSIRTDINITVGKIFLRLRAKRV